MRKKIIFYDKHKDEQFIKYMREIRETEGGVQATVEKVMLPCGVCIYIPKSYKIK